MKWFQIRSADSGYRIWFLKEREEFPISSANINKTFKKNSEMN
jgi:hypothetical protein